MILRAGTTQAFFEEAVPAKDINTILTAGLRAESAMNQQPWLFVALTDKAMMKEVAGLGDSPLAILVYMDENSRSRTR